MPKSKKLYIDADSILYNVALARAFKAPSEFPDDGEALEGNFKEKLGPYKRKFKSIVQSIVDACQVESVWESGFQKFDKVVLVYSPTGDYFRHKLSSTYKCTRSEKPEHFYRLRKWAHKSGYIIEDIEADDVVAYFSRKGHPIASADKDVLKNCVGTHYDIYHKCFVTTTEEEARRFTLMQTLSGDSTDDIDGLNRVGLITADKLLTKHGCSWESVVSIYESKGKTEADAILARRLIGIDQWHGKKKGLKLWHPKTK